MGIPALDGNSLYKDVIALAMRVKKRVASVREARKWIGIVQNEIEARCKSEEDARERQSSGNAAMEKVSSELDDTRRELKELKCKEKEYVGKINDLTAQLGRSNMALDEIQKGKSDDANHWNHGMYCRNFETALRFNPTSSTSESKFNRRTWGLFSLLDWVLIVVAAIAITVMVVVFFKMNANVPTRAVIEPPHEIAADVGKQLDGCDKHDESLEPVGIRKSDASRKRDEERNTGKDKTKADTLPSPIGEDDVKPNAAEEKDVVERNVATEADQSMSANMKPLNGEREKTPDATTTTSNVEAVK